MAGFDIDSIANLACIELTDAEREAFTAQFPTVLSHIEKIRELDVDALEPTIMGHRGNNIFREDVPQESLDREIMMNNAPARIEDEVRMPRIVE